MLPWYNAKPFSAVLERHFLFKRTPRAYYQNFENFPLPYFNLKSLLKGMT